MEHHVDMRIVLNVSVDTRGYKSVEIATERVEQEINDTLESLTGRPCAEFGKPSICEQTFLVSDIEITVAHEVS